MADAITLLAAKCIQNNWSKTINDILRWLARLMGLRSKGRFNQRVWTLFIMRNDEPEITKNMFHTQHGANIYLNNHSGKVYCNDLARLEMPLTVWSWCERNIKSHSLKKIAQSDYWLNYYLLRYDLSEQITYEGNPNLSKHETKFRVVSLDHSAPA